MLVGVVKVVRRKRAANVGARGAQLGPAEESLGLGWLELIKPRSSRSLASKYRTRVRIMDWVGGDTLIAAILPACQG